MGVPLGLGQILVYCIYCDRKNRPVEDITKFYEDKHLESIKEESEEDKTQCLSNDVEMQLKV